jgi:outer membrane receptor protein involved in Fe transport
LQYYGVYGFQFAGNYFQNYYDNKFRLSSVPGIPVAFYDNAPNARITGLEGKASVFLLRKKLTLEAGISRYFISEKTAFPFKSDLKRTLTLILDHAGYSLQIHHFKEGEQVGLVRRTDNSFSEIAIPDHTNLDLHVSKTFKLGKFKLFANASGRNLLNTGEVELLGLALRDRRYYFTVSAQY